MSIIPSASAGEPRPVAVPVPDRVAALIGSCMPIHNLARANKTLAAYDPRLMVRAGGAR